MVLQPSPTARDTVLRLLGRWRQVMFAYSAGPLAWSIVAFRNSLVFHSLDKVQTAHCHAMEYQRNPHISAACSVQIARQWCTLASSVAMWRHMCRCVPRACPPADRVTDDALDADVRAVETRCGGPPHGMCGRPRFDLGVHSWSPFSIAMSWQRTADHVADAALDAGVRAVDAALVPGPQRQAGL